MKMVSAGFRDFDRYKRDETPPGNPSLADQITDRKRTRSILEATYANLPTCERKCFLPPCLDAPELPRRCHRLHQLHRHRCGGRGHR
mmetsp:Transcript_86292/g.278674  ORF Transcript_86292/g.278674 Transcript_86292/m.278674 type:complete len:87 (-) Transcript_86292:139-399(-)